MLQFAYVSLIVVHVLLCLFLILLILIQNDKGGGLAGAFGGLGGGAAFTGSSTATFLTKLTGGVALVSFFVLIGLNFFAMRGKDTGLQESELKGARRGLSTVLPGGGAPQAPGAIPGLGGPSEPAGEAQPAPGQGAPSQGQ